jgi:prepilin-type N-terminal cleavage/methylation domain-containing protein
MPEIKAALRLSDRGPEMLYGLRHAKHDEDGFTLIELLIVIVILGILAAVVVFAVNGIQDKGKVAACKADVQTVTTAGEAYYASKGSYAGDISTLVAEGFLHSAPSTSGGYSITYTLVPAVGTPPLIMTVGGGSTC